MKPKIKVAALFLTSLLFMTSCGNNNKVMSNENISEEVKTTKYQCPMKCEGEKIYEEKGICPVCEMDLEKVTKNENHQDH